MPDIFYLSQGKMYTFHNGQEIYHPSEAVDKYRRNILDIYKRKEWKTSGQGAMFMGGFAQPKEETAISAQVEALCLVDDDTLIYGATMENSCGIYVKDPQEPQAPDRFIVRRTDTRLFYLDYEPEEKLLVVCVSDGPLERHLVLCHSEKGDFDQITEGESIDIMPSFSHHDPKLIYFSSAGIYFDPRRHTAHVSAYAISKLNLRSGEISEVNADAAYDFIRPRENVEGILHCIRRPKKAKTGGSFSPIDIVLIPFRLLRAIFSWLNFFSQRYTGESLTKRSSGLNPAKNQQKSEEEIFIEGNLINAAKSLRENTQQGDRF
ncbi:MAG: hypothetical protein FWG43_06365, partial [Clostridiales bacterium]|nr:hypothetical protein [Clostridiales bacterium]